MRVTADGVAVGELLASIKNAIKLAQVSATDADRDLKVTSIRLTLNTVATYSSGGKLEFKVPVIGMGIKIGRTTLSKHTHAIDLSIIAQEVTAGHETRDDPVEAILVEAINTIRTVLRGAADGDDSFRLDESTVELAFAITADGSVSIAFERDSGDEVTHTMKLTLTEV
ncbi:trypco2 family protein [Amycolatopsis kentuckyensis]|uniref:trypco2 family protein n=1 Tax=Amycolatopsis kentuckyensis TaxID=218823 RepID=UPI0035674A90